MTRFVMVFAVPVLALVASAKTYDVKVFEPITVNGKTVQPGECKANVEGAAMTLKCGKVTVDSAVKVEQSVEKFRSTSMKYEPINGRNYLREVRIGGTNMKLVLDTDVSQTAGSPSSESAGTARP